MNTILTDDERRQLIQSIVLTSPGTHEQISRAVEAAVLAKLAQQADRHALQAQGKHPAPCAKFCESKAYEIDARSLRAQIEVLEHYRKVYGQVSGILAYTAEVGPIEPGDEITVRRLKMLVADLHTYVQRCQAKDALLRQAVEAWDSDEIETDPVAAVIEAIRQHLKGATK